MKILYCFVTLLVYSAFAYAMVGVGGKPTKKYSFTVVQNSCGELYYVRHVSGEALTLDEIQEKYIKPIDSALKNWRKRIIELPTHGFADFCTANKPTINEIGMPNFLLYCLKAAIEENKSDLLPVIVVYAGIDNPGKFMDTKMRAFAIKSCFEWIGKYERCLMLPALRLLLSYKEKNLGPHYALRGWAHTHRDVTGYPRFLFDLFEKCFTNEQLFSSLTKFSKDYTTYGLAGDRVAAQKILDELFHRKDFFGTEEFRLHKILEKISCDSDHVCSPYNALKEMFKDTYIQVQKNTHISRADDLKALDTCVFNKDHDDSAKLYRASSGDVLDDTFACDCGSEAKSAVLTGARARAACALAGEGADDRSTGDGDAEWDRCEEPDDCALATPLDSQEQTTGVFAGLGKMFKGLGLF